MPQLVPMVLKDHKAASRTFNPRDVNRDGIATLTASTGVPIADKRMTLSLQRTASGKSKVTMKLVLPQVQLNTVSGVDAPKVVRAAYAEMVFTFDDSSSLDERLEPASYIKEALSDGENPLCLMIKNLQGLY